MKKKATRTPAEAMNQQAGMKGMPMMSFPMAKTYADFEQQFELLSVKTEGDQCAISVLPRDVQARKFLKQMNLSFSQTTGQLSYFEMVVRDGSSMRNDFDHVQVNEKIDRAIFNYDLTGYSVTDAK
ncbi:MAG: outer-membrane lipoprotein carrier protein LolA [Chthoniobacteraceae bacterium]